MALQDLTKDTFKTSYENNDILIVDFWAEWCGPCRNFSPIYEKVSEKYPDILFGKVDTEAEPELASHFSIMSIPTLLVIRQGIELYCEPGMLNEKQLTELVERAKALDMDDVRKKIVEEQSQG